MNATDFFTQDMFHALKQDIQDQKRLTPWETPYQKKLKVKGNTYHLSIVTGNYSVGNKEFYVSFWEDHNYSRNGHRDQGGSSGSRPNLETWYAFKDWINKQLSRFPDYTPEANEQLCWF